MCDSLKGTHRMRLFRRLCAVISMLIVMICMASFVNAAEDETLRITPTIGEKSFGLELENLSEDYIGNVTVYIQNPGNDGDKTKIYGFVGSEDFDKEVVRSIAPGDIAVLNAERGDSAAFAETESLTEETVGSATAALVSDTAVSAVGGVSPAVWVIIGVIAVAAAIVLAVVLKKKNAAKNISAVIVFAVMIAGLGGASVNADGGDNVPDGRVEETFAVDGESISVVAEYLIIPEVAAEPLMNTRRPPQNDECNTPQVDQRRLVENAGPMTGVNIYIGKNDFMFLGDAIDDYTGKSIMSDARLKKFSGMMNERDSWAEENGIKLYLVIAPNKSSVYPDYVPKKLTPAEKTNADAVVEYLENNSTVEVIDLRQTLIDARDEYGDTLFYKYDTHWNNNGGFVGYSEIMRRINEDVPGTYTLQKSDFEITEHETYMKDMAYYLGYYSKYEDFGPVYTLKNGMTATLLKASDYDWHGQFRFCSKWKDGYSDSLKYVSYENIYNTDAPSVYVYRDSFSVSMIHFLKDSFHNSVFDWSYDFNKKEILDSGASVVIMEVVEKQLVEFSNARTFATN